MKIQFAAVLKDWDGDDMKEVDAKASKPGAPVTKPLTLGGACCNALNMQQQQLPPLEEQIKRGNLAVAIRQAERDVRPLDLTAEQIVLIKQMVGQIGYPPNAVVAIVSLLDPPADEAKAA